MAKRDYYEVLGVKRDAGDEEIKRAYRKAAKECHPDLHPDDHTAEERFKELNEAYEVLSDAQKRSRYDQFGFDGPNMGGGAGAGGFGGFGGFGGGGGVDFGGFESIFDMFTGMGGNRRQGPVAGDDLKQTLIISFEEAAAGCKKSFEFTREELCETCGGSGAKKGSKVETCPTCGGSGQVRAGGGLFVTVRPCAACGGQGKIIKDKCGTCGGSGRVRKRRTATINVPAGIDNGQSIVMNGQGEPGLRGGPNGDLYVQIAVRPHSLFQRDGFNIRVNVPVSITQAALGGDIEVPTLNGRVRYRIPEGTQNDTEFRMKGQGIPYLRGSGKGDLILRVRVDVPRHMTEKQKELLRQFDAQSTGREYDSRKSFLDRMKDLFNG